MTFLFMALRAGPQVGLYSSYIMCCSLTAYDVLWKRAGGEEEGVNTLFRGGEYALQVYLVV